jgi:outer membrane receptor for ferrienterochelin and colicins
MKFKFYLSSLTLLLATFFMVNAQTNTVTGKINDGVDAIYGVNVIIQGTTTGVVTGDNGVFTLSSDKDLPWTLEISYIGYQNQTINVKSTSDVVSISLSSGEILDEVVISGSRKAEKVMNAASSITVIGAKEIENKSAFNSMALLDDVLGVQIDKQGANRTNISLRDNVDVFTTSTLIMLDYRTMNLAGLNFFDADASNLSNIDLERVEVVRGPASALYGPGVGAGVVHYLSKDPFKYPGSTILLQTGGFEKAGKFDLNMQKMLFRHAVSNKEKTFGYKFNLKYQENEDFDLPASTVAQFADDIKDPSGRVVRSIGGKWQERAAARGADATLYYRPSNDFSFTLASGINETAGNFLTGSTGESRATQAQAFVQARVQSKNLFAQWNFTNIQPHKEDKYAGFAYRAGAVSGVASKQSQLQVQYELSFDQINTKMSIGVEHSGATFETNGGTFGRNESSDDYRVYGAYFSTKTDLSDKLNLQLAGRHDHYPAIGENSFSPRAALVFKPSNRHSLRLTFNKAYVAPSALNLFLDQQVQDIGYGNVWIYGNRDAQTFNNIQTTWLVGGGALPKNTGIGMNHATAFALVNSLLLPGLAGTPLAGFIPFLASQNTLASVAGLNGFTNGALLDLNGKPFGPLEDGDKGTLQTETHYELGYKGMLSDKLTWNFNVYNAIKENFVATVQLSPLVALPTLGSDLGATLLPFFTSSLTPTYGPIYGAAYASALANQYAAVAGMVSAAGALGVIESDQAPTTDGEPNIMIGYKNFGKVNYWGFETGMKWRANDNLTFYGNYSTVSQTTFKQDDVGSLLETGTWSLNHSKHRAKAGMMYGSEKFNYGIAYKYDGGFDANMGSFYSGTVLKRNLVDANLGYNINSKTSLGLNVINLMDEQYSVFPNMAQLGRQVIVSLKHDF